MVTIERTSMLTGITHEMSFAMDKELFVECLQAWEQGALIQNAFPMLNADEREFIKTGITPQEWESSF